VKSLSLVVLLAALPAFAALGPSFEVPVTAPTIARAPGAQGQPRVATDGRDFFAVWLDGRGGTTSVFGTRILADGTVLDPTGIVIASPGVECDSLGLVWDGLNYVVVWRETYTDPYFETRASFARIDRNGTVLGGPKTLLDHSRGQSLIASNGHGSVVIFAAFSGSVVRIDQDGSVSQRQPKSTGGDLQIASNGDGYLVSWTGPATALLRLDNNGDAVGPEQQLFDTVYYTQLTARIGGPYLLAARKSGPDFNSCARSIVGRLITSGGVSNQFVIHDAGSADIADIVVRPDGNGFQVVWLKRLGPFQCEPLLDSDPPTFHGPWPSFGVAQIHVGVDGSSSAPVTVALSVPALAARR